MDYSKVPHKRISVFEYPWYVLRRKGPATVFGAGMVTGLGAAGLAALLFMPIFPSPEDMEQAQAGENAQPLAMKQAEPVPGDATDQAFVQPAAAPAAAPAVVQQPLEPLPAVAEAPPEPPPVPTINFVPKPVAKPQPEVVRTQVKIQKSADIPVVLAAHNVREEDTEAVVAAMARAFKKYDLKAGRTMSIALNAVQEDGHRPVDELSLEISPTRELVVKPDTKKGFRAEAIDIDINREYVKLEGRVRSSFLQAGTSAGVPQAALLELIGAFSYDIDFQRDIQPGDKLTVVMDRTTNERGELVKNGSIVYARLDQRGKDTTIYRFDQGNNQIGYFHEDGRSVRKGLMRTPIDGARITSGFGMRMHPLLGYSKMHRGVDFGAPTGTPVYAAGDGQVAYAGGKGGYGNYIQLSHSNGFATAYGHLSRIAAKIRPGVGVKQGQLIGYVGSTGMSTGPHLHYEILVNGAQVNPQNVKFAPQVRLAGKDLKKFKSFKSDVQTALDKGRAHQEVASAE
ncbi:peptidoglycan DD-metalloendopeptidase family protein [bacterium]|nr:peptidoglycan DD-metalloendopeptidase family protein [bacterium]